MPTNDLERKHCECVWYERQAPEWGLCLRHPPTGCLRQVGSVPQEVPQPRMTKTGLINGAGTAPAFALVPVYEPIGVFPSVMAEGRACGEFEPERINVADLVIEGETAAAVQPASETEH